MDQSPHGLVDCCELSEPETPDLGTPQSPMLIEFSLMTGDAEHLPKFEDLGLVADVFRVTAFCWRCATVAPQASQTFNRYPLKVSRAPNPTDINWRDVWFPAVVSGGEELHGVRGAKVGHRCLDLTPMPPAAQWSVQWVSLFILLGGPMVKVERLLAFFRVMAPRHRGKPARGSRCLWWCMALMLATAFVVPGHKPSVAPRRLARRAEVATSPSKQSETSPEAARATLAESALTRETSPEDVFEAIRVLEKAKNRTGDSGFTKYLTGDWRLIYTTGTKKTEDEIGRVNYVPITAVQRFDMEKKFIRNGVYLGPISLEFEGGFRWIE
ncbi:unnamed protein product, partial [Symbiodinium sp. KB8]